MKTKPVKPLILRPKASAKRADMIWSILEDVVAETKKARDRRASLQKVLRECKGEPARESGWTAHDSAYKKRFKVARRMCSLAKQQLKAREYAGQCRLTVMVNTESGTVKVGTEKREWWDAGETHVTTTGKNSQKVRCSLTCDGKPSAKEVESIRAIFQPLANAK